MFYKPKYCCNCSEKIERTDWNLTASRRFCRLCETDFIPHEWIPRVIVFFGIIGLVVGIAGYFQKPEKTLKIAAGNFVENASPVKKEPQNQTAVAAIEAKSNVQSSAAPVTTAALPEQKQKQTSASAVSLQNTQREAPKNQLNFDEQVYFCGASTKKGTACSRRVKGGGRCWQHAGQPAILPPEKLLVSR